MLVYNLSILITILCAIETAVVIEVALWVRF